MSGYVTEFSGATGPATVNTATVTITSTVPSGNSLVATLVTLTGVSPNTSISATDTKGNTWTHTYSSTLTASSTAAHIMYAVVTTPLVSGDIVTFTYPVSVTRSAISISQFDDSLAVDVGARGDNGGASTALLVTDATSPTSEANELVFGSFALVNSGRIFTATNGFTALTKQVSSGGAGDRAIAPEYKYVAATGNYTANGTLNSSGTWVGIVQTFTLNSTPPGRSGRPKVWDGSAWVAHDAKVWDGSAWVTHKVKGYDSGWVESK